MEAPESDWMSDVGKDLDEIDRTNDIPRPAPREPRKPKPEDDAPPPNADDEPPPDDKQGDEVPPDAGNEPPPPAEPEPKTAPELRKAFSELKKKVSTEYTPKITQLEAKVRELESKSAAPDPKAQERVAAVEKRNQELEDTLKYLDYVRSKDYQEKYDKPFRDAWANALNDIAELEVETSDGQTRPASDKDLVMLAGLTLGQARREANRLFGDSADDVMSHVRNIKDLYRKQQDALSNAQKDSQRVFSERQENAKREHAERLQVWEASNKELATKYPTWFAPVEGDTEGNKLLAKGFALADMNFREGQLSPEEIELLPANLRDDVKANGGRFSPKMKVRFHALIRNKIANHDRLARRLNDVRKELAEARKALKEYEDSGPPGPGGARRTRGRGALAGAGGIDEAMAELDGLDR
jgi:hypothetical protein